MAQPAPAACVAFRIQPRASADAVVGDRDGAIAIRLRAAPLEGAANEALIRFLALRLQVPRRSVQLVRGHSSRRKWAAVEGLEPAEVRRRLLAPPG